jgi:uncharacterized Tic20 family protein
VADRSSGALPVPTQDERTMGFLAHLLQIFTGFIGPLVILIIKNNSPFVKFHALQALIWQICYMVLFICAFALFFLTVFTAAFHDLSQPHGQNTPPTFILFFPLLWLFAMAGWVTNVILGVVYGIKANRGEWAAYPLIGRWCLPKVVPGATPSRL